MTYTTPESQATALIEGGDFKSALKAARVALRYHTANKNPVSAQFWTHTIFVLKRQAA